MSFKIYTDSSSNLPSHLLKERELTMVPFDFIMDGELKRVEVCDQFDDIAYYSSIKKGSEVITSQISPQKYLDFFEEDLKNGFDILFIGMSSGISGSYASSRMAANELREQYPGRVIYTFDTRAASLGEGIAVLHAADLRDAGRNIHEIYEDLFDYRERICQVFTVDDLMHLKKTGRVSNASAVIGTILHIKPVLMGNENGQIVACGKVRGRKASIDAVAEVYLSKVTDWENQTVGIAHAMCEEDAAYLVERISEKHPKTILVEKYEQCTGSHVGPGALALFFTGDYGIRIVKE